MNFCETLETTIGKETFFYSLVKEESYGIKIKSSNGESATVRNVCSNKKEAQKLMELLCKEKVTPTTLLDILTDYVDERDFISWHVH